MPQSIRRRLSPVLLLAISTACATSKPKTGEAPAVAPVPRTMPAVALRPADEAHPALGVVVTAAAPERLAANLDALAKGLQLDMPLGQTALDKLAKTPIAGLSLTRDQLGRLDPEASVAVAVLVAGAAPGATAAFTFKDKALAQRTLEELGTETQRVDGASGRKLPDGVEVWTGLSGRTLLAASTREALLASGALALEAQKGPRAGELNVTIYPQVLAQAKGMPLATMVEMAATYMASELDSKSKGGRVDRDAKGKKATKGKKTAKKEPEVTTAMRKMVIAGFRAMAQPIVEAQAINFVLKLGTTDGFLLRSEIVPLPGSPSAGRTKVLPYVVDARLAVTDDRQAYFAFGEAGNGIASLIKALSETGPAGKVMGKHMSAVVNELVVGGTCTIQSLAPLATICALPLRQGVTPMRAIESYASMMASAQAWQDEVLGTKKSKNKVKRTKDVLEVEMTVPNPDPAARAVQRAMWGGDTQRYAFAVRDGRLIQAQGAKPTAILAKLGEAPTGAPGGAPIFASTLDRTKGAEVLVFIDLVAFVSSIGKAADEPQMKQLGAMMGAVPGLAELKAPLVVAVWGGKTTAIDLQFPYQTLTNVAQVVKPFLGMMGGAPKPN